MGQIVKKTQRNTKGDRNSHTNFFLDHLLKTGYKILMMNNKVNFITLHLPPPIICTAVYSLKYIRHYSSSPLYIDAECNSEKNEIRRKV